ncbi:hypothetical protein BHE74_00005665 [Ensete ventricosum]|nr:hypothetical protein GW17_00016369 [Ensete ventricosum]RWW85636.1 hypothetical protein BHE74_00005665 [Ensete ventricosum]
MVLRIETGETAHRYRRLWRRPKDSGTLPLKRLLERSKDWSFGSSPSSGGSSPDMLLFCNNLKKDGSRGTHAEEAGGTTVFLRIEMSYDHRPATGINRVFVPIAQNLMRVVQFASNGYQSLHWRASKQINPRENTRKRWKEKIQK